MEDKIHHSEVFDFNEKAAYSSNAVVSKRVIQKSMGNITLFAFDEGQELSEHSAPFDALVQVIDGEAEIYINHKPYRVTAGKSIIMPANILHAVKAVKKFRMLLTMIRE
jgi:quercetin dioxygenase-like cupin family protein